MLVHIFRNSVFVLKLLFIFSFSFVFFMTFDLGLIFPLKIKNKDTYLLDIVLILLTFLLFLEKRPKRAYVVPLVVNKQWSFWIYN